VKWKKKIEENRVTNKKNICVLIDDSTSLILNSTSVVVFITFFEEEYPGGALIWILEWKNSEKVRKTLESRLNS
jgi:hypothetical protein